MRLLDRYLLRELLVPFGYCLCGFCVFWISFDVFTELDEFQEHHLTGRDVVQYYLIKMPELLVLVLPIALLLALLYALTNHARHHELTAMRAAGISLARLALPYFVVGLVLGSVLLGLNELWVPQSQDAADAVFERRNPGARRRASRQWETKVGFTHHGTQRRWFIEAFNTVSGDMLRPHVEWAQPAGRRRVIDAESAAYVDGAWLFTNAQERVFSAVAGEFPTLTETKVLSVTEWSETPEEIRSAIKIGKILGPGRVLEFRRAKSAQFSIREILAYKRVAAVDPVLTALLDTKLHGRLAAPWTCLVVVLIALPFGAGLRRRNVFVGVASSILIGFAYFILQQLALALGGGGHVSPWMAAWSPNVLFALTGLGLSARIR